MPTHSSMPNYVRGVSAAGEAALVAIASSFADWQLKAPIDTSLRGAEALAADYLKKLSHPEHVFGALPADAQDRVAAAVGCTTRAAWAPAEPIAHGGQAIPSYRMPSWEKDVYAVLFLKQKAAPPRARETTETVASHSNDNDWPELSSLTRWKRAKHHAGLAESLALALGKGWKPGPPAGSWQLPSVRSVKLGVSLVAIPGGTFEMGLSLEEHAELKKRVKGRGAEASVHVRELAKLARPVHRVKVGPFLCATTPLRALHMKKLGLEAESGDSDNPHGILRVDSETASAIVAKTKLRLLAESAWEWLARAAGTRCWLSGERAPEVWAEATLASALDHDEHPFGIAGLGWGEWIDDGWHPNYVGAPNRSTSWEPETRPTVVRGGALAHWPWQVGGELVLAHAAARDRAGENARHAVRLALALPARGDAPPASA